MSEKGKLIIISAPSGAGKTTIVKHLLESGLGLSFSVSATTRHIRGSERNGIDYFYLSVPEFIEKIVPKLIEAGANIIGGCCGTTPEHIKVINNIILKLISENAN